VKPAAFGYAKARTLDHALELLASGEGARILAGGQSLIPALNMRLDAPRLLVDINGITELEGIARQNGDLRIGALTRHAAALRSDAIAQAAPLIAMAMPHVAHPAIRNRGTVGGSIALSDPATELPACLLALGGAVEIAGRGGRRSVAADKFFKGLFDTALEPDEVLTAISVPAASSRMRYGFAELARRHGDYALVGLAASAEVDGASVRNARLAFFGVGATAMRARRAEASLTDFDATRIDAAVAALAHDLDPHDDLHASGRLRLHLAGVLLRRVAAQMKGQHA
jgi:carbon-monoxide dehydrogenase medium subunit